MSLGASKTLITVQALRALAASAVVVYHVLFMLVHNGGYSFAVSEIGASGVDLFFVISGFIMIYTTYGSFRQPKATAAFIRRRAIRIIPIYWFYTTVIVLLLAFAPTLFSEIKFNWQNVISSYLFLLSKNSKGDVGTVMQTGWTLCFEVYFYLMFAILLNLPRKYFLIISGTLFMTGIIFGASSWSPPTWAGVATNPILFEFYLGTVIAFLFVKGFSLPPYLATAAIILSITAIFVTSDVNMGKWTRVICWGLPGGILLLGALSLEHAGIKVPKLFTAIGDSSYSLYLVHPFLVPAMGKVWMALHLHERLAPAVLFIVAFICSITAGHMLYLVIEKPITQWLSRTWKSPAGA
ncbi:MULTISPECIES: acyltransferase family protein [Methylomonas]|uniref:acyltransferase family protein n=1 Tax=Methylomonas TaxID=416 RepID=UPI001680031A|nr:acyltransferase [Methylomonas rhizoryzae]